MRRMVAWCVVVFGCAAVAAWGADADSYLGYIKEDGAYVEGLRGVERVAGPWKLPHSEHAVGLTLSPADGAAVYFTYKVVRESPNPHQVEPGDIEEHGWVAPYPYDHAEPMPGELASRSLDSATGPAFWSADGQNMYWAEIYDGERHTWRWDREHRTLTKLPFLADAITGDGKTMVGSTDGNPVVLYDTAKRRLRSVVGRSEYARLWAALRAADHPQAYGALDPATAHSEWSMTAPAIALDGEWVWFGATMGCEERDGTSHYALFAYNVGRRTFHALSKLGVIEAEAVYPNQLSGRGDDLLLVGGTATLRRTPTSSSVLQWVHLPDQLTVDLTRGVLGPYLPFSVTQVCWSPLPECAAVAVNEEHRDKPFEPTRRRALLLVNVRTRAVLRTMEGAWNPAWTQILLLPGQ